MTEKEMEILKYHKLQIELADLFYKLAKRRLEKAPKEFRWLLMSRSINSIFHHHYGMSIEAVKKHEKPPTPPTERGGEDE